MLMQHKNDIACVQIRYFVKFIKYQELIAIRPRMTLSVLY